VAIGMLLAISVCLFVRLCYAGSDTIVVKRELSPTGTGAVRNIMQCYP
jgi:hypothetical protein